MHDIFRKTLGGLTREYYFRQFFFGVILSVVFFYLVMQGDFSKLVIQDIIYVTINTFLYPYSRFIYESIMDFFIGDNRFWLNAGLLMLVKGIMMLMCWAAAIFIAPVGLLYLYFVNRNI